MRTILLTSLPVFVCLFWSIQTALELYQRRTRHLGWLLVFMLVSTILYTGHFLFFNHVTTYITLSDTLYSLANLAVYPLYLLYIRSLTHRSRHGHLHWIALLPTVVGGALVAGLYLVMNDGEISSFIEQYLYDGQLATLSGAARVQAYVHDVCKALFALQIVPVFILGGRYIRQFNREVASAYASTEGKTLHAMHVMLIIFAFTSLASFVSNLIGRQTFFEIQTLLFIPSLLYSGLLFAIGYIGCRQQFSIADIERDERLAELKEQEVVSPDAEEQLDSHPVTEEKSALCERIDQVMRDEQLFLNPNLKLNDLVVSVGSNRNYVYNAINRELGVSFNEYVNRMRVDYAVRLMHEQPSLILAEVGERSGFASATSFYRNFRLFQGCSPKEYQQKLRR